MIKKNSALLLFIFLLSGCATVPVTGRRQLDLVSSSEINSMSAVCLPLTEFCFAQILPEIYCGQKPMAILYGKKFKW